MKDNRCTYRIQKEYRKNKNNYYYRAQYKYPGGWFWWTLTSYRLWHEGEGWQYDEADAKTTCYGHAIKYMNQFGKPGSVINLGKLP